MKRDCAECDRSYWKEPEEICQRCRELTQSGKAFFPFWRPINQTTPLDDWERNLPESTDVEFYSPYIDLGIFLGSILAMAITFAFGMLLGAWIW